MQGVSVERWVRSIHRFLKNTKKHHFNVNRTSKMKLVQEDEKNSLNGVSKQDVEEKEREITAANGVDQLCSDSQSNLDSLLCEDSLMKETGAKEGSQNGSGRPDDARSWSSSSSILPSPAELEDEFSEDLRLQISDEEDDDSKSAPLESSLEKDSPPLPSIGESSFSDVKNPFRELLDDENCDTLQKTVKDTPQSNETVEETSSSNSPIENANKLNNNDSVSNINNENNLISVEKESGEQSKLDDLIADIVPDNSILSDLSTKTNNDSVTELRQEIEDVLKKGDDNLETELAEKNLTNDDDSELSADKMEVDENEETGNKIEDTNPENEETDNKIENSNTENTNIEGTNTENANIEDTTTAKEDISEEKIENNVSNMEVDEDPSDNVNNSEVAESPVSPDTTLDLPEKEDQIQNSVLDDNEISKDNDDMLEDNLGTSDEIEEMPGKSSEEPAVVTTSTSEVSPNVVEPMEVTDTDNIEDINSSTAEAAEMDLVENEDVLLNKIDEELIIPSPVVENTSIETKEITKDIESSTTEEAKDKDVQLNQIEEEFTIKSPIVENTSTETKEITKDKDSSTAEEAEIVTAENKDVQLNKIEQVLIIESPIVKQQEIKEEETKKELDETIIENAKCLKRSLEEDDSITGTKKPKINGIVEDLPKKRDYVALDFFRDFMSKKDVKSMTRLELEELCLQKMCEVVNQTSKIGDLQRTLKQQEQITEGLRLKYSGLKKQISDLTIVQTKIMQEMKSKLPEGLKDGVTVRDLMPVKITRSVGLQVNLQAGMRAVRVQPSVEKIHSSPLAPVQKRKLQRPFIPNKMPAAQQPAVPTPTPAKPIGATIPKSPNVISTQSTTPKTGIKTILPKEPSDNTTSTSLLSNYLLSPPANSKPSTPPTATRKAPAPTTNNSTSSTTATIDLTDEDDKTAGASTPTSTAPSIRVVNHQLMGQVSTANTKSVPITYLVSPNQQQQVILTSSGNTAAKPGQVRPAFMLRSVPGQVQQGIRLNIMRPTAPGANQGVVLPSAHSTVRTTQPVRIQQVTTTTTNSVARSQMSSGRVTRHPAPLPGPPAVQPSQPSWKAMPPKPSLKISRVGDGIVLSWKMLNKNMSLYEDIASYQLYAYQETSSAPATEMWRKVGDVKALALPMACTLTQFTDGNKYHFAVRAVDVKSRVGPFSQPEQIALP